MSEISQKILLYTKLKTLAQLWPNIMQAYISRFAVRIFFKLCSMIGLNKLTKFFLILYSEREQEVHANNIMIFNRKFLCWWKWVILGLYMLKRYMLSYRYVPRNSAQLKGLRGKWKLYCFLENSHLGQMDQLGL